MDSRNEVKSRRIDLQRIRFDRTTAVIGAFGAVFAIATGVLGFMTASLERDNASLTSDRAALISAKEELEFQLVTANAEVAARDETVSSLRAENQVLRAAAPYTVDPDDVHPLRATAAITLARNGDTIDLNSVMPNFGAGGTMAWSDSVRYDGDELRFGYGVSSLTLPSGIAKYETCAAATGYASSSSIEVHLLKEPAVCLRLQSGRFAAVQVTRFDEASVDVTFTVWE
ncbi:hypothetical protein [Microbacterium sp. H83]|uniref:hypothetical protein n=1 Tax=Microbacterium sp. H83 TaxID=1827324 RepID=UPI0012F714C5|nr:hypothetical protein [Microbacterium sp. H83]